MKPPHPKSVTLGFYKIVDGVWCKRCAGATHESPIYLPPDRFYKRKSVKHYGQLHTYCIDCQTVSHGNNHLIRAVDVVQFYREAAFRIGIDELSRRTNLDVTGLKQVIDGKTVHVRKANLTKVMAVLRQIKKDNEWSAPRWSVTKNVKRANGKESTCPGCGTHTNNYTDGCLTCMSRRAKRNQRKMLEQASIIDNG